MGRKSAKLNVASLLARPPSLDEPVIDWIQIERAYGRAIPHAARDQILHATNRLLEFSAFALAARPIAEAIERLNALRISASNLLNDLVSRSPPRRRSRRRSADNFYLESVLASDTAIQKHLTLLSIEKPYTLNLIADMLSCLIAACKKAEKDFIGAPDKDRCQAAGLDESLHWAQWIRRLTAILREQNLPVAASKGADKTNSDKPSAFVALVYEIQRHIPNAKFHSYAALAQAITRARQTK